MVVVFSCGWPKPVPGSHVVNQAGDFQALIALVVSEILRHTTHMTTAVDLLQWANTGKSKVVLLCSVFMWDM